MGDDAHNKFRRINSLPYPKKIVQPTIHSHRERSLSAAHERDKREGIREIIIYLDD